MEECDERVYRLASARAATDRIKRSSVMCNVGIFSAHIASTEKIAEEKFFFRWDEKKMGFSGKFSMDPLHVPNEANWGS